MLFLLWVPRLSSQLFALQEKILPSTAPHTSEKMWWATVPVDHKPKSASHESTGHKCGPLAWKFMASPLSSSLQVPLETPSLIQTSLPLKSLPKWKLVNYVFPFTIHVSSLHFLMRICCLALLSPGTFVFPPKFDDKETDLSKHIFLHHLQMFDSPQMLERQYVPNKYFKNS